VLRLVEATIRAGRERGIPVSMCGEMAANSRYTRLLLGMGLRELSVPPNVLLEIKQVISETDTRALEPLTGQLLAADAAAERAELLASLNRHP
jgi:phosphotransferase system enzyme I (PtsI)